MIRSAGLLALDVDGTLLRSDNTLSARNEAAVRAARAQGWHVILATGKPPWAIRDLSAHLELAGPHIIANGAGTWSLAGTHLLHELPPEAVSLGLRFGATLQVARAISGPAGVFCQPDWGVDQVTTCLAAVGEPPPTIVPDAVAAEPHPWKVILIAATDPPHPPALAGSRWVRTHPLFFEAVPASASKGATLHTLCAALGLQPADVVAVGDGANDIEMLRWAGLGIAMAHAPADVRALAAIVTKGNDEDGVALALEPLLQGATDR